MNKQTTNKQVIFSIMLGNDPMFIYAEKAMRHYAKKTGSDLYIMRQPELTPPKQLSKKLKHIACFQKKYIFELMNKYDRVLYIDADILITPDAEDIFLRYPDAEYNTLLMYDEFSSFQNNNGSLSKKDQETFKTETAAIAKNILGFNPSNDIKKYFNAGVILIGKNNSLSNYWIDNQVSETLEHADYLEQSYINALIIKHGIKTIPIDENFNRIHYLGQPKNWGKIHFIHFAGGGYFGSRVKTRPKYFRNLYLQLNNKEEGIINTLLFWVRYSLFIINLKIHKLK